MDKMSPETSDKISFLSFAGIVCVCILHTPWPLNSAAKKLLWGGIYSVCPVALAFFFAFSGYFLARHWQEPGWWRKAVVKRVFTLVVPYFIWLLAFLSIFVFVHPDFSFFHYDTVAELLGFVPWQPPRLVPLWFLRCLFFFALVSPLVVKAVAAGRGRLLLAAVYGLDLVYWTLVGMQVIGMETPRIGSFFWYGFNLDGFVYFVLGVHLAVRPFRPPSARTARACGCVAAALVVLYLACLRFPWCRDVYPSAIVAPFLAVFVWNAASAWKFPGIFRNVVFPVYLLHTIVLEVYCYYRGWCGRGIPECLLILAMEIALPIAVCQALRRTSSRIAALLFGGR